MKSFSLQRLVPVLLILLVGCDAYRTDNMTCCVTPPVPVSEVAPTVTEPVDVPLEASRPVPLRIYDVSEKWTYELSSTTTLLKLSGLPLQIFPLDEYTHSRVVPGRCNISAREFGRHKHGFQVELQHGEAVLIDGAVLICEGVENDETLVGITGTDILAGTEWSYR